MILDERPYQVFIRAMDAPNGPEKGDCERIWSHLAYEIGMFAYLEERLGERAYRQSERNALLEAYALHARALFDFIYHSPSDSRAVLARHFVRDIELWRRARGKRPPVLDVLKTRVGQEVAHLTYDRLDVGPEAKGWDIPEISKALRAALANFLSHARDEFPAITIGPQLIPDAVVIGTGTDNTSTTMFESITLTNTRR